MTTSEIKLGKTLVHIPLSSLSEQTAYMANHPRTVYSLDGQIAGFLTIGPMVYVLVSELTKHVGEYLHSYTTDDNPYTGEPLKTSQTIVIVDSRFANGIEMYFAAYYYMRSINKPSEASRITLYLTGDKLLIKGERSKTITLTQLREFSETLVTK